jgi:membrane fusion protein (multidrug efflux system)
VVFAFFLAVLVPACQKDSGPAMGPLPVTYAEIIQRDVPIYREWVGEALGMADVEIRARVPGYLEGIHFVEGTRVEKDQLLYTIDAREMEDQVAAARASLAEAQVLLANAEANAQRYRPLAEINAVSQRDLDNAEAQEGAAQQRVAAAKAQLSLAETQLGYTRIRAPFEGVIGFTQAKVGDFVGQFPNPVTLNTISKIDPIHVRFALSEREYLEIIRRMREQGGRDTTDSSRTVQMILADGSVHPHPGTVEVVERAIDPSTGSFPVEARFPNPEGVVRPGQYTKVRAVWETRRNATLVPQRAVIELQGQYFVYVIDAENKIENRSFQPGPRLQGDWVVDRGLSPGERVVVEGLQRARPGIPVQPLPASETAPVEPDAGN